MAKSSPRSREINGKQWNIGDMYPIPDELFREIQMSSEKIMITVGVKIPQVGEKQIVDRYLGVFLNLNEMIDLDPVLRLSFKQRQIENSKNWIRRHLTRTFIKGEVELHNQTYPIDMNRLDEISFFVNETIKDFENDHGDLHHPEEQI